MATQDDVRRIALALPGVVEEAGYFAFNVEAAKKAKNIVWTWRERVNPKKSRVPNPKVVAIRVANELEKQALLSADERKFFTEPHYDGYPAVLVNLEEVTVAELEPLIREAWRCRAPQHLIDGTAAPTKRTTSTAKKKPAAKRTTKPSPTKRPTAKKPSSKKPATKSPTKRRAAAKSSRKKPVTKEAPAKKSATR
jgi:hypothetical protein